MAIALAAVSICAALILVAGSQSKAFAPIVLDASMSSISSAFSETDRAANIMSNEGGLSLAGRDYEVRFMRCALSGHRLYERKPCSIAPALKLNPKPCSITYE